MGSSGFPGSLADQAPVPPVTTVTARRFCAKQLSSAWVVEARDGERVAWRVRITGPKPADRLAEGLCAAGLGVVEVAEKGSDLERTFLALTSAQAVS